MYIVYTVKIPILKHKKYLCKINIYKNNKTKLLLLDNFYSLNFQMIVDF